MGRFVLFVFGLLVVFVAGCGGIKGDYGTLEFEMVDAPAAVSSFKVHIKRIEVEIAGDWEIVAHPDQTYELMDLLFDPVSVGTAGLSAGNYTRFRVVISRATVTDNNGTQEVAVPQAVKEDGLVINVPFAMESARRTTLLMDFNAQASLTLNPGGTYSLAPVIPTVVKSEAGTVEGFAALFGAGLPGADVKAVYTSGPNYAPGTVVNTGRSQAQGQFKVWALLPGVYTIELEARHPVTGFVTSTTVTGVTVTAGTATQLGTLSLN